MTLPDKQKEALPRLVGWEYKPICKDGPSFWQRIGSVNQIICPDMATPEGMVELHSKLASMAEVKNGVYYGISYISLSYAPYGEGRWNFRFRYKGRWFGASAQTSTQATADAVHALLEGGYLTEKEPTDGN